MRGKGKKFSSGSTSTKSSLCCNAFSLFVILIILILYIISFVPTKTLSEEKPLLEVSHPTRDEKSSVKLTTKLDEANQIDIPQRFKVNMTIFTTSGISSIIVEVHKDWAPIGAKRFLELVDQNYYDGCKFFRAIKKFMAQTGIHGEPAVNKKWQHLAIRDDPVSHSNRRGTLSFASSGKNSRSTQFFINFVDNSYLDHEGFTPFGRIVEGIEFIDSIYTDYGEGGRGDGKDKRGPSQMRINREGNVYLEKVFPKLSYIVSAAIM